MVKVCDFEIGDFGAACNFFAAYGNVKRSPEELAKIRPTDAQLIAAAKNVLNFNGVTVDAMLKAAITVDRYWLNQTVNCWTQEEHNYDRASQA